MSGLRHCSRYDSPTVCSATTYTVGEDSTHRLVERRNRAKRRLDYSEQPLSVAHEEALGLSRVKVREVVHEVRRVAAYQLGADTPLDKQLAETVGKRLERQAQKVRDDVSLAAATEQQARACARLAAAADGSLLAALPAELAAIDAAEKLALEAPRNEVYVGFHELISLLPRTPEPPTATAAPTAASVWAAALQAAEPTTEPEIPSIPDDLAHSLGRDGVQALWNHHHRDDHCEQQLLAESADWWKYLPSLVAHTLIDSAWAYQEGKADGVRDRKSVV
jgi:hypothetical protein